MAHVSVKQTTVPSQISVPQACNSVGLSVFPPLGPLALSVLAFTPLALGPALGGSLALALSEAFLPLALWPCGPVALWPFGPLALAFGAFGPFAPWPFGPFALWSFWPFGPLAL